MELKWDPTDAGVFGEGEVGFTRGRYELVKTTAEGAQERQSTGSYLTIWQRLEVGWRVVLDTGDPDDVEVRGIVAAGTDIVAIDAFGATLLGHRPEDIGHIAGAAKRGLGTLDFASLKPVEKTLS